MLTDRILRPALPASLLCLLATPAFAQTLASVTLDPIAVIGSPDNVDGLVGSGAYISRDDITRQGYDDINRLLREIPGVYARAEDGYGLFPNISLRGTDGGRSSKVTLMEDGVLTAPAPYSDAAAYYSPTAGRMSALEVLKGSSQVQYGPRTTGGVINYLSTPIPDARQAYLRTAYGSDNEFRNHLYVGETSELDGGSRIGYLVELYHRQNEGFKDIDIPGAVGPDQGQSGFTRIEPMIKLSYEPQTALYQRFEFKYGRTELNADETYLGLTQADFRTDPYRRYAASRFDNIETEHQRSYLRHQIALSADTNVTTTLYANDFHRNWFKLRRVNDGNQNVSLGVALADPAQAQALAVIKGEAAGRLDYRNNNREYGLKGIESLLTTQLTTGSIEHTLSAGIRLHEDFIFRFQDDVSYTQDADGFITDASFAAPGSQDNRRFKTRALSAYLEDAIEIGKLTLKPGVRIESLDWSGADYRNAGLSTFKGDDQFTTAGLGLLYTLSPSTTLFGGIYQGLTPPSPSGGAKGSEEPEESLSVELGLRSMPKHGVRQEMAVFATRFENLLVSSNMGASGSPDTESVGEVDTFGVEYALSYDAGDWLGDGWGMPVRLALTYTDATIANDSNAGGDAESIFSGGRDGAQLPYIPQWQASLITGLERGIWTLSIAAQFVDRMYASALNTNDAVIVDGSGNPAPDARGGVIPSIFTLDITVSAQVNPQLRLFTNVFNALDREYEVSRIPEGPRPGAPLSVLVGAEMMLF